MRGEARAGGMKKGLLAVRWQAKRGTCIAGAQEGSVRHEAERVLARVRPRTPGLDVMTSWQARLHILHPAHIKSFAAGMIKP